MRSAALMKSIRVQRIEGFSLYTAYATARFWGVAKFRDSQVTLIGCQPLPTGYYKPLSLNTSDKYLRSGLGDQVRCIE